MIPIGTRPPEGYQTHPRSRIGKKYEKSGGEKFRTTEGSREREERQRETPRRSLEKRTGRNKKREEDAEQG